MDQHPTDDPRPARLQSQRLQCSAALGRAMRHLSLCSPDALRYLLLARQQIDHMIKLLQPPPRRSRASIALLIAVSVAVFVAAPIGLRLLVDRPAAEAQR